MCLDVSYLYCAAVSPAIMWHKTPVRGVRLPIIIYYQRKWSSGLLILNFKSLDVT